MAKPSRTTKTKGNQQTADSRMPKTAKTAGTSTALPTSSGRQDARPTNQSLHPKPSSRIETKPIIEPTADEIATAAYFLWLERGGNELVNWLEAERLLRSRRAQVAATEV